VLVEDRRVGYNTVRPIAPWATDPEPVRQVLNATHPTLRSAGPTTRVRSNIQPSRIDPDALPW
jgi:hypothetical protein